MTWPKEKIGFRTELGMSAERKAGPTSVPASYGGRGRVRDSTHSPLSHKSHELTPVNLDADGPGYECEGLCA